MMNIKRMLASMLVVAVILFSACGDDDDSGPKNEFKFEGEDAVSLKDANLYLVYEGEDGSGHLYRDYFITDGTFEDGSGWSFSDYTDATYILAVELGVPVEEDELSDGEYPLFSSFSAASETSRVSWVSFETTDDVYFEIPNGTMGGDEIEISGDFDDGDKMTIKFSGTLTNYTDVEEVDADGKIYFKGDVEDVRTILARKTVKGGAGGGGVK